jgi:ATP-binding cassette subfamily C (CFTR/MRP) protein 2
MHIQSEAKEIIEGNHPPLNWPVAGKVEINDLKVIVSYFQNTKNNFQVKQELNMKYIIFLFIQCQIRYRPDGPLVLHGITCTFEAGHKIGIVGRTGCGKSTLIGALFRLVEPEGGKVVVDGIDISTIGLHDLRSRFGIIPQDPTLFNGTVRFNMDPLSQHTDQEIWEVKYSSFYYFAALRRKCELIIGQC